MPEGLIVKALSGYYYVVPFDKEAQDKITIQCRARGIFKLQGVSPLVGDRVIYEITENGEGVVDQLLPRSSELIRPPIANVDLAVLIFSLDEPALNLLLLDKFLIHIESAGLETIIIFTKLDLMKNRDEMNPSMELSIPDTVALYERIGYKVLVTSAVTGEGTEEISHLLAGHISVLSGQSGVGKSSLLNRIIPGLSLETNQISRKLGRGKHTTRHVELLPLDNGGIVADTPGFSQLDFLEIKAENLGGCFKEFRDYSAGCKFRVCQHDHEPDCKVIAARDKGDIAATRYINYLLFLNEMKDKKRRY